MPDPGLVGLLLADARLPVGGHTQSAGLEPAVAAGLVGDGEGVSSYVASRLATVVRVEAGTAVVARHVALGQGRAGGSPDDLLDVEAHWAARTPSAALRVASRRLGRGWLRLAARVWPATLDHLPPDAEVARPVVLGVVGAVTGLDASQVARLAAYDDAQTVTAASLKLLPSDPVAATARLAAAGPLIEAVVAATAHLSDPAAIPAAGAPMTDVLAERHARATMRLFHA